MSPLATLPKKDMLFYMCKHAFSCSKRLFLYNVFFMELSLQYMPVAPEIKNDVISVTM